LVASVAAAPAIHPLAEPPPASVNTARFGPARGDRSGSFLFGASYAGGAIWKWHSKTPFEGAYSGPTSPVWPSPYRFLGNVHRSVAKL